VHILNSALLFGPFNSLAYHHTDIVVQGFIAVLNYTLSRTVVEGIPSKHSWCTMNVSTLSTSQYTNMLLAVHKLHVWQLTLHNFIVSRPLIKMALQDDLAHTVVFFSLANDSVDEESHFSATKSRRVRLRVHCGVNAEWDSTLTESTRKDEIFVNTGAFRVDSVDVESHSALTQLTWNPTPPWLSWRGIPLRLDSVDVESHSALTQLTWNPTPR
jgi:hypothetical protein